MTPASSMAPLPSPAPLLDQEFVRLETEEEIETLQSLKTRITDLRVQNAMLWAENRTLIDNVAEQQKEIVRLNQLLVDQNKEFQKCLQDISAKQIKLEERLQAAEKTANYALISTCVSTFCAVIGGTIGFTSLYQSAYQTIAGKTLLVIPKGKLLGIVSGAATLC